MIRAQVAGADSAPLTDSPPQSVQSWACVSGLGYLQTDTLESHGQSTELFASTELLGPASKERVFPHSQLIVP